MAIMKVTIQDAKKRITVDRSNIFFKQAQRKCKDFIIKIAPYKSGLP